MELSQSAGRSNHRLVLFAHGSRDPHWRHTFEQLAQRVADGLGEEATALAYMQMAEPTLAQAVAEAAADGVERVSVLPLFLSAGGHVANDVPQIAEAVRSRHPQMNIEVMPPVGEDPRFVELVVEISREGFVRG